MAVGIFYTQTRKHLLQNSMSAGNQHDLDHREVFNVVKIYDFHSIGRHVLVHLAITRSGKFYS